jgi:transcriptional regulator with XRE-family HTH domain
VGFFDLIAGMPGYRDGYEHHVNRLNKRHAFLIEPFRAELEGARVLDLASHDGRWPYALAGAGAAEVVGVEGRADLVREFRHFPDSPFKARVDLRCNDIFAELEAEAARGARYDVVAVFGIFYHIMDHFRLLTLIRALGPRLILMDSDFATRPAALIWLTQEDVSKKLNAIAQVEGQARAVVGTPSFKAMEWMAAALGYTVEWLDWTTLPEAERAGLDDYFSENKPGRPTRRATCALRPGAAPAQAARSESSSKAVRRGISIGPKLSKLSKLGKRSK